MDRMGTRDLAIGLDIGGTKMKCGVVDAGGKVIGSPREVPTNARGPREKIVAGILDLLNEALSQVPENRLRGIGIGCSGPLDIISGTILKCNTLPTMHNYPLKHIVELTTCKEVHMNNDANAMMLGEAVWGAGRGRSSLLGITLGTGCGCAFINDGRIWTGYTGNAGRYGSRPIATASSRIMFRAPALPICTRLSPARTLTARRLLNGHVPARKPLSMCSTSLPTDWCSRSPGLSTPSTPMQ